MNKRKLGNDKEDLACRFLEQNNVKIISRNYNTYHGEIDIIGFDGETLCFFEVKYREDSGKGSPFEAVTKSKIMHIIKAAKVFLYRNHYSEDTFIRFDCIGIQGGEITWIKNAFEAF